MATLGRPFSPEELDEKIKAAHDKGGMSEFEYLLLQLLFSIDDSLVEIRKQIEISAQSSCY